MRPALSMPQPDLPTRPTGANAPDALTPGVVDALPLRKRPRPGERRVHILQALAVMLEQPTERVTTAALAARLQVSEAALYRHFASKAQMFEGLIAFIEDSVFGMIGQIQQQEPLQGELPAHAALRQAALITRVLIQFAEKNPGMARVMVGDALVFENERLQARVNLFFDKVEAALRQCLRLADERPEAEGAPVARVSDGARASVLTAWTMGSLQRYVRSGYRRLPSEQLDTGLRCILG